MISSKGTVCRQSVSHVVSVDMGQSRVEEISITKAQGSEPRITTGNQVGLSVEQAKEYVSGLQMAIARAKELA